MNKQCPQCGLTLDVKRFTLQLKFKPNVPGLSQVHSISYFLKCPSCGFTSPMRNNLEELDNEIL